MSIDYSVIIRTTGKAKEKYAGLLTSVSALDPRPKEVIVVLPEGYPLPEEQLGWETFYFSPKGMVVQRMTGIRKCKTKYALICDDDVQFGTDFVRKLHEPIQQGMGSFSIAPLYGFLPRKGAQAAFDAVRGAAIPTVFHKDRYCSVLRTTGYSYNRKLNVTREYYETQSAAWTCFYADVDALRSIDFETEQAWLDAHGYSAMDDQTMFCKAWLRGFKTIVVADAVYTHLDAGTSTQNNKKPVLYSSGYNRVIFWHRFIYRQQTGFVGRVWSVLCFAYYLVWAILYDMLNIGRKKMTANEFQVKFRGFAAGWQYVNSGEYRALPKV